MTSNLVFVDHIEAQCLCLFMARGTKTKTPADVTGWEKKKDFGPEVH